MFRLSLTTTSSPHFACAITRFVTRVARYVPLVDQDIPTLPEYLSFCGVRVVQSLVFCVIFWWLLFFFYSFTFSHFCVSPSNYGFWIRFRWYHQPICRLTYTYALGVDHIWSCKLDFRPWRGVHNAIHLTATGQWFYTDSHKNKLYVGDIGDIVLNWCIVTKCLRRPNGVMLRRKSKKFRQYQGQKRTNNRRNNGPRTPSIKSKIV